MESALDNAFMHCRFPGQKPKVTFTINEEVAKGAPGEMPIPRDHNMILTGLGNQNLVVFSQTPVTVKQGNISQRSHLSQTSVTVKQDNLYQRTHLSDTTVAAKSGHKSHVKC